ncbi:class I SAM-dependent methyltransferase [Thalassoglobus sp. JC818]|uniref:class I SAM-dependent methyltransferase n=1 Tax=Thalassoglobus sp. JC818 TaxID=3232136 RepID=UPI003459808B
MQVAHLDELKDLEESYWWHVAKRDLAVRLLNKHFPAPGKLVEGGVGSARNLMTFREMGYDVQGFDVMPESVEIAESRGLKAGLHDLAQPWPVEDNSLRAVVLLDVIEHIEDPVAVLKNVHTALEPGGGAIITVPAYQWMFSDWDEALGHYRRYTMKMLRKQATEAGLQVKRLTHWNAFTLPAAVAVRSYEKIVPRQRSAEFPRVSNTTNGMLLRLAAAERWMMDRVPVPVGLSVVGVLTK